MHCKSIHGFSIIEVLVSILLLSLLLLIFESIGWSMLQSIRSTYYLHVAAIQLNNMTERLQALGNNNGLENQIRLWNKENQKSLPRGSGQVSGLCPHYTIIVSWGGETGECIYNIIGENGCLKETINV